MIKSYPAKLIHYQSQSDFHPMGPCHFEASPPRTIAQRPRRMRYQQGFVVDIETIYSSFTKMGDFCVRFRESYLYIYIYTWVFKRMRIYSPQKKGRFFILKFDFLISGGLFKKKKRWSSLLKEYHRLCKNILSISYLLGTHNLWFTDHFPFWPPPAPVQLSPAQNVDHNDGDGKNMGHMAEGMGSEGRKHGWKGWLKLFILPPT